MENLSTRLKMLRNEKNVQQKDVAKFLDISSSAYGYYEQGKRKPKQDIILKLSEYYDVSIDYLLGQTDKRNIEIKNDNLHKEKDIEEEIEKIINSSEKMNFCGKPPEAEDMKFLRDSLRATLEYAKTIKNKK